jgi:hypothetical protein
MPKIRNIIIFVVIAAVIGLGYMFFFRSAPESPTNLVSNTPSATTITTTSASGAITTNSISSSLAANDFLSLLLNINNIKLNDAIFSDPAFVTLRDSSISLVPDGTEGRHNPFAQFGNDAVFPSNNTTTINPPNFTAPSNTTPANTNTSTGTTVKPQ